MENVDKGKERATTPPPDPRDDDVTTPVLDEIFDVDLFNDPQQHDEFCEEVSNMMHNPPSGWESMNVNMLMAISPQLGQILFPPGIPLAQVADRYGMIDQALNIALGYWQRNKPAASAIPSRIHTPAVPSRRDTPRFPDYRPGINLRQFGMSSVPPHFAPPEDPRFRYRSPALPPVPDHQQAMDALHQSTVISMRRGHNNARYSTYQRRTRFNSEAGHLPAITPSNPYGQFFDASSMAPLPYPYNVLPASTQHLDAYGRAFVPPSAYRNAQATSISGVLSARNRQNISTRSYPGPGGGGPDDPDDDEGGDGRGPPRPPYPPFGNWPPPPPGGRGPPGGPPDGNDPHGGHQSYFQLPSQRLGHIKPKAKEPEYFDGTEPEKVDTFLVQCLLFFQSDPFSYADDIQKVNTALSYMKGNAIQYFFPYIIAIPKPSILSSWEEFTHCLHQMFGNRNSHREAQRRIDSMRMSESQKATKYLIDFFHYAPQSQYDNVALASALYRGLPDCLKDEITRCGHPEDIHELRELVLDLDSRFWERERERKSQGSSSKPKVGTSESRWKPATDTSKATSASPSSGSVLNSAGRLSDEERERRRLEGRCYTCGEKIPQHKHGCTSKHASNTEANRLPAPSSKPSAANTRTGRAAVSVQGPDAEATIEEVKEDTNTSSDSEN